MEAIITTYLGLLLPSHFSSDAPVLKHDCNKEMIVVSLETFQGEIVNGNSRYHGVQCLQNKTVPIEEDDAEFIPVSA